LSQLKLSESSLITLIADSRTLVPQTLPNPLRIHDISTAGGTIVDPDGIAAWILDHLRDPPERPVGLVPPELRSHGAIKVLQKACRLKQYWLRRGDDVYASRILDNELWPMIEKALSDNNLIRVEFRQASGTNARFIHVRQPDDILSENTEDSDVVGFYKDLLVAIKNLEA
jgi:hypothetical protein